MSTASLPRTARAGRLAALVLLFALPVWLRLWPIGHGLPHGYVPDTHVVRSALGMAKDQNPVPRVGQYSTYPNLLPYALLPVYASQYALGRASGQWAGSGEYRNALLEHPELAHLPARILLALVSALTAWAVFRGARAAGLGAGAWVAAWLVATGLLHTHFSVQERPWAPMTLFMALSAWAAAVHMRTASARSLVLAGAAAGLAFATHQAGAFTLALPGLAWLCGGRGWRGADLRRRLVRGTAAVLAFLAVGLVLGHPYILRYGFAPDPSQVAGGELLTGEEGALAIGGQAFRFALRTESLVRLSRAFFGYDPALVVLGLLGLYGALALRGTRPVLAFALVWAAVFFPSHNDHVRYLLPVAVLLPYAGGVAAELLLARRLGRVALVPLLALPLVQDLRLGWVLRQTDTRALAEQRLAALPAGARLAIDRYGPLVPPDVESLRRLAELRELGSRESHRLMLLEAYAEAGLVLPSGPGSDVVRVEDLFSFDDRERSVAVIPRAAELGTRPDEVLRALGVTHVLLVDRRPGDGAPSLLAATRVGTEPVRLGLAPDPIWILTPGRASTEAFLPTEMDFPLTGLWTVERPGPELTLYALAGK